MRTSLMLLFAAFLGMAPVCADDSISPKLNDLRAKNEEKITEASSGFDDFNRLYFTQLEKLLTTAKEEGNLDLAVAAREEQEAFRDRGEDFPEPSKLPALAKLQNIYAAQYPKLVADRNAKLVAVRAAYRGQLDSLIKELTKDGSLDLAMDAKKELTALDQAIKTAASQGKTRGVKGHYVRVELNKKEALSLAEVEVFSGDKNIAPQGVATQQSIRDKGDAQRGIDGNTSGKWADGSVTHTEHDENPWWELDLLKDRNLTKVVVWNRFEYSERLDGFRVLVLDADRKTVWQKKFTKAPLTSIEIELGP